MSGGYEMTASEGGIRPLRGIPMMEAALGDCEAKVGKALADLKKRDVPRRIWARDHTVWKPEPAEISNRLGWLIVAEAIRDKLSGARKLALELKEEGCERVLLLGMGGSSLAPEVLSKTFGPREGWPVLDVLDSTDPEAVLSRAESLDPARTLFLVSTKSGGTVETLSFFKFFHNRALEALGAREAGRRFAAVTDPGSKLADLAGQLGFRKVFLNDPDIGGRYSALSYFGLVPAALMGLEPSHLVDNAMEMISRCRGAFGMVDTDPAVRLGAIMGALAREGRDKLTLVVSPAVASLGDWVEQLVAESTGKEGKGVLPVVGEPLGEPDVYGADRFFVHIGLAGEDERDAALEALVRAGHPVVRLCMEDFFCLGGQFFLWEMATVVASHILGINPFNQPNVESAKVQARKMVAAYLEKGELPRSEPSREFEGVQVYGRVQGSCPTEALDRFAEWASSGAYMALQAYLPPSSRVDEALEALRVRLRDKYRLAVTTGYGPRFLHSTGQLHKGDAGRGLFVQITADSPRDAPIPDEPGGETASMTFGVLEEAQAAGDRQALLDAGRSVLRFHLTGDVVDGLRKLTG